MRPAALVAGLLAGLALGALVLGPVGCAPARPPLAPLFAQANQLEAEIDKRARAHEAESQAMLATRVAACPPPPDRDACALAAARAVVDERTALRMDLLVLSARHDRARADLLEADRCATAGDEACARRQQDEAQELLRQLAAALGVSP